MVRSLLFSGFMLTCIATTSVAADAPIFSGPQVGEKLVPFKAYGVFGDAAGQTQVVLDGNTKDPTILVFVHQLTRPSIGLTRMILNYADSRKKDGLQTELVFLSNDRSAMADRIKRARHALPTGVSPRISADGIEGPGPYGLNRKVAMTVLVGNEGKVTANFALGQPSIQVDGPKVGHAIVQVLGGDKAPTLKQMGFTPPQMRRGMQDRMQAQQDSVYRQKIAPVIRGETIADVKKAAEVVEAFAKEHAWFRDRVGKAANLIVNGPRFESYGRIPEARAYLKKWAKDMKPADVREPGKRKVEEKKGGQYSAYWRRR